MQRLSPPKNQMAYILHTLLNKKTLSEQELSINGFRSRISDLITDYSVQIDFKIKTFTNRFGRKCFYRERFIKKENRQSAIEVYEKINSKKGGADITGAGS